MCETPLSLNTSSLFQFLFQRFYYPFYAFDKLVPVLLPDQVAAGTTDFLDFLGSRRIGHYWVFGKSFLGQDVKIDIRMEVDDSNGAASLVDAIRAVKLAIRKGETGAINSICAHLFKSPPLNLSRRDASIAFKNFVNN
jgi:myo-inositol-1-phosphate synthase